MSNQIQLTGGAKVRSLEGVITGTSGVLSSVPLGGANGVATLDSGGKVPVSQLPSSVVTYLGTWNAATNTPTLANGTGDAGDMYICNVAGTVNFGAGPITFAVGDWVLYGSGTWQKSNGQNGTVTSVAASITGDAIGITGSPITTAGTLALAFAGTSGQYINGAGNLVTFPTIVTEAQRLVTEVYNETGATLSKGTVVYINGGHGNLPTVTKAIATGDSTSAQTYGVVQTDITNMNNGYVVVIGSLTDLDTQAYPDGTQLYLSSTTAGAWTSTKQYAPAHLVYVAIVVRSHPTQGVVEVRIQNGFELDELHNVSAQTPSNNDGIFYNSTTSLWESKSIATALGYTPANDSLVVHLAGTETITGEKTFTNVNGTQFDYGIVSPLTSRFDQGIIFKKGTAPTIFTTITTNLYSESTSNNLVIQDSSSKAKLLFNNSTQTYTFPAATGTIALTSDLAGYVDLTTAQTIGGTKTFSDATKNNGGIFLQNASSSSLAGYMNLGGLTNGVKFTSGGGISNTFTLPSATGYTFTFPNTTGTVALTSDLSSYVTLATTQTISGAKTFSSSPIIDNGSLSIPLMFKQYNSASFNNDGYTELYALNQYRFVFNFNQGSSTYKSFIFNSNSISLGVQREYTMPNASGTLALTSDIPSLSGYVQGTGTTNYLPKFTGTSTIGNSIVYDDGTNVGIGTTTPSYKLDVNDTFRASGNSFLATSSGDVGIGTLSPNLTAANRKVLDINGTNESILVFSSAGTYKSYIFNDGTNLILQGTSLKFQTGFTDRLTIASTGAATFSSSVTTGATIQSNDQTAYVLYNSSGTTDAKYWGIQNLNSSGTFRIRAINDAFSNGINAIEISRSGISSVTTAFMGGNVLINTTSDAGYKLDVNGTGRFSGKLTISNTSDVYAEMTTSAVDGDALLGFSNTGDANSSWGIGRRNTGEFWIANYTGNFLSGTRTTPLVIASTGAATFSSSVTAGGDITINQASQQSIIFQTSGVSKWNIANNTSGSYLQFYNYTTSSASLVIANSSGNVGIGTSSPGAQLEVMSTTGGILRLKRDDGSVTTDESLGTLEFYTNDGDGPHIAAYVRGLGADLPGQNYGRFGALSFGVSKTANTDAVEAMRIDLSGNVGIGTSSPTERLDVIGGAVAAGNGTIRTGITYSSLGLIGTFTNHDLGIITNGSERMRILSSSNTLLLGTSTNLWGASDRGTIHINGSASAIYGITIANANAGYMYHNGTDLNFVQGLNNGKVYVISGTNGVYLSYNATSWTANSDERLKNINSNIDNALSKLMTLRTINFSWKSDKENKENLGLIAQDVEKVFPQVIDRSKLNKGLEKQNDDTEYLGVRYQELVPVLVRAIQEQQAQIEELKQLIK